MPTTPSEWPGSPASEGDLGVNLVGLPPYPSDEVNGHEGIAAQTGGNGTATDDEDGEDDSEFKALSHVTDQVKEYVYL